MISERPSRFSISVSWSVYSSILSWKGQCGLLAPARLPQWAAMLMREWRSEKMSSRSQLPVMREIDFVREGRWSSFDIAKGRGFCSLTSRS